jgi:hypothetical protein
MTWECSSEVRMLSCGAIPVIVALACHMCPVFTTNLAFHAGSSGAARYVFYHGGMAEHFDAVTSESGCVYIGHLSKSRNARHWSANKILEWL